MEVFAIGDIILVPFPYSDNSKKSVRPALVLQITSHGDAFICMITTNGYGDKCFIDIPDDERGRCGLMKPCVVRYTKVTVIADSMANKRIGRTSWSFVSHVRQSLAAWLTS